MVIPRTWACLLTIVLMMSRVCQAGQSGAEGAGTIPGNRPVTVRDAIAMNKLGLPEEILSGNLQDRAAIFSPNHERFLVVLKKGNLERNANEFSVLLYDSATVPKSPAPRVLLTLSSTSNHEAIRDIKWRRDGRAFFFLGEEPGGKTALYRFSIAKKLLERVTHHDTPVVAYDASTDGKTILFEADPPITAGCERTPAPSEGVVITTQSLMDLLESGCKKAFMASKTEGQELFVIRNGTKEQRIPMQDVLYQLDDCVSLSPDGRYGLVEVAVRDVPPVWSQYKATWLQLAIHGKRKQGEVEVALERLMLVDTDTLEVRPLLNTPIDVKCDRIAWLPDGNSVVLSGAFLPLDGAIDDAERRSREETSYVVEISIPENHIQKIASGATWIKKLDRNGKSLTLARFGAGVNQETLTFEKAGAEWREVSDSSQETIAGDGIRVVMKEDANTPPRIYVQDPSTRAETMLLDLNPWLGDLAMGQVEVIRWKAKDGHEVLGGLFYPPDYVPGQRYPLVVQTHGFLDHKFYMDGPWSSGFAARPLAARGIMVLQVGYPTEVSENRFVNTPQEAPEAMGTFEGAIDYLNERGLIDDDRIGILGFSRTVFTVGYTLTHSSYKFAAATLVDGITGGYMGLMAFPNDWNTPGLNGGLPFGPGLISWIEKAPEFNLDKVSTPVRLEAYHPGSILGLWEWFTGLSLQSKPVDFIYLPNASHLLVKPSDRLASQQGNVDWFCFWLKGEENPDPAKKQQYERWRRLRGLKFERNSFGQ
jgi:dipeptidyl aminopeptidase/acylaminoacyl peptidase